jgi:hypothetical protein
MTNPSYPAAASFADDRSLRVPAGKVVKSGYVSVWKCQLANRERMAVGDVAGAFGKLLQLGEDSLHPCPNGHWEGDEFVIHDGRHEYLASLMLGRQTILVAWVE